MEKMSVSDTPYEKTLTALDALHAEDPYHIEVEGKSVPRELWHTERMSHWLMVLSEAPSELLQLAVRAQHLQRWQLPRQDYPEGRVGYLTWRRDQGRRAGETAARLMEQAGYTAQDAARVAALIRKQGLGRDPETQALEDCACLVFLEHYFADFARQVEHDQLIRIVQKTWRKMSPQAHKLALALPMTAEARGLVEEALGEG